MQKDVERYLSKFRRGRDDCEEEIDVTHIPFALLAEAFPPAPDDPLLYCAYRVQPQHLAVLQKHIGAGIDLDRYEYFLEARQ